jgi:SAM-dependent methyltransferase
MNKTSNPYFIKRAYCPVCDCSKLIPVYRRYFSDERIREYLELAYHGNVEYSYLEGHEFEVVECEGCGFLFQTNVLTETGAQHLYDVWIDPTLTERYCRTNKHSYAYNCSRLSFVYHYVNLPMARMLDYGAGFGNFCHLALGFGFEVSALEFSRERIALLNKNGIACISVDQLEDEYYHFVWMNQVLEHLSNPLEVLRNVHRVLHTDGIVAVSVPKCSSLKRKLRNADSLSLEKYKEALKPCAPLQHINSFTHATLVKICRNAGFSVIFRPLLRIGCSRFGLSIKESLKNVIRPFYEKYLDTTFFLRKS